jgi:hypothetical protein
MDEMMDPDWTFASRSARIGVEYVRHPPKKYGIGRCMMPRNSHVRSHPRFAQAALGGSLEKFRQYAANPVFGYLVNCDDWEALSIGPVIQGTPTRGAMQTVLMAAKKGAEEERRTFLWTLQQERRPPLQGCWIIHEVLYVKNAFAQTL